MVRECRDTPIATNSEQKHRRRERITRRAQGFWSSDRSLTALLVLLVGNIFIIALAGFAPWARRAGRAILSLIIISGLIATCAFAERENARGIENNLTTLRFGCVKGRPIES